MKCYLNYNIHYYYVIFKKRKMHSIVRSGMFFVDRDKKETHMNDK